MADEHLAGPVKVGVIGCGRHAQVNLYPALPAAGRQLVATCARHLESAQATADRFGAAAAYADPHELLNHSGLDAVVICVPAGSYGPLLTAAVQAGVPAFVEKPGAAASQEATSIAAQAAATGVPVMVGYMKRFAPAYVRAAALLADPEFGEVSSGGFTFVVGSNPSWSLHGYITDATVHALDLARSLIGEVGELQAQAHCSGPGMYAIGALGRASKAPLAFQLATSASWHQTNEVVGIIGDGHALQVTNVDTFVHRLPDGPERVWRPGYTVPLPANLSSTVTGFVPELEHFRSVLLDGATCRSDLADAGRHPRPGRGTAPLCHREPPLTPRS